MYVCMYVLNSSWPNGNFEHLFVIWIAQAEKIVIIVKGWKKERAFVILGV